MRPPAARTDPQTAHRLEREFTKTARFDYLLALPRGYEKSRTRWPLVLFLHGSGERGSDLERVKVHGPPKLIASGASFPFILVSPQCPEDRWWDADELGALLDELEETLRVDTDRVYVTGLSMGGYGAWDLAVRFPDRFAAIMPVCGGGKAGARRLAHLPVWAFHGAKDTLVPVSRSREMIRALREAGNTDAKLTVYKEVGHNAWDKAYSGQKWYGWLLEQVRQKPKRKKA